MNTEIVELNTAGLRRFAFITAGLLAGLFGAVLPLLHHRSLPYWPWIVATLLLLWGMFLPERLRKVYRVWMVIATFLGKVNSMLLLSVVFICVISPVGIVMRLLGYDPLNKKLLAHVTSYRKLSAITPRTQMEKPY